MELFEKPINAVHRILVRLMYARPVRRRMADDVAFVEALAVGAAFSQNLYWAVFLVHPVTGERRVMPAAAVEEVDKKTLLLRTILLENAKPCREYYKEQKAKGMRSLENGLVALAYALRTLYELLPEGDPMQQNQNRPPVNEDMSPEEIEEILGTDAFQEASLYNLIRMLFWAVGEGSKGEDTSNDPLFKKISASYVDYNNVDDRCDRCFKEFSRTGLKRCGRCKVARYCSAACQKLAWSFGHNAVCEKTEVVKPRIRDEEDEEDDEDEEQE